MRQREDFLLILANMKASPMGLFGSVPPMEVAQIRVDLSSQRLLPAAWGIGFVSGMAAGSEPYLPLTHSPACCPPSKHWVSPAWRSLLNSLQKLNSASTVLCTSMCQCTLLPSSCKHALQHVCYPLGPANELVPFQCNPRIVL